MGFFVKVGNMEKQILKQTKKERYQELRRKASLIIHVNRNIFDDFKKFELDHINFCARNQVLENRINKLTARIIDLEKRSGDD